MIEVKDLKKTWRRRGKPVGLLGASFTVPDGQIVGVLGDNGAGKTTLLRTMAGLLPAQGGTALFDGRPAAASRAAQLHHRRRQLLPGYDGGGVRRVFGRPAPGVRPGALRGVFAVFLPGRKRPHRHLSTGQKARVELAAGFAKRADYYLMDEPFLGKDAFTRKDVLKLMSGVLHGGETILLTTHYLDDVEQFLDRVLVLHDGVIADDFLMEDLQQSGETLLARLGRTCGWDPARYLQFGRGEG